MTSFALVSAMVLGCAVPEGGQDSPSQAHYGLVRARAAGDLENQWKFVHPDIRHLFSRWLEAERSAVRTVRLSYPEAEKEEALEALVQGKRAGLPDARALYGTLVPTAPSPPLAWTESLGARVLLDVSEGEGHAELLTLAWQKFHYRRGDDGRWYAWPSVEECTSLDAAVGVAEANLEKVKRNVQVLRGERPGPPTDGSQPRQSSSPSGQ